MAVSVNRPVGATGTFGVKPNNLTIRSTTYNLNRVDAWDNVLQPVWIVRILTGNGEELVCARICGEQEEVDIAAREWLNDLCRANRGEFLRFATERVIEY